MTVDQQWQQVLSSNSGIKPFTPFDGIILRKWPAPVTIRTVDTRPTPIQVQIASTNADLAWADQFVAQRYLWRGYSNIEQEDGREKSSANQGDSVTLLASRNDTRVGTITVGMDGHTRLVLGEDNGQTINRLRQMGRRVGEFIRLAVYDDVDAGRVLYHLFRAAYDLIRIVYEATDILIEVNPRHARFYQRVLGFTVAAGERMCARVNAPAILLRLDLVDVDQGRGACNTSAAVRMEPQYEEMALAS